LAAELRWILLGLSLPLLGAIWWWTARRAGQTPGNAELRESTAPSEPRRVEAAEAGARAPVEPPPRDWGVPPFEPLNIRTAEFDRVPVLDGPMMVHADPAPIEAHEPAAPQAIPSEPMTSSPMTSTPPPPATPMAPPMAAPAHGPVFTTGPVADNSDQFAAPAAPTANAAELQRIVTVRVCCLGEARWSGTQLMAALELHGLAFGRYQVFHRKHVDGRSLFCVASLIEPGTFDIAGMVNQEFRGVTLFAVLPGPIAPLEAVDELLRTARGLAEELSGVIQDAKGIPLSPQRAGALREDVARFQSALSTRNA
jgi:cell division protein ZipA